MDTLLHSTYLVAIAEIGDKTQFLSFFLATRYHRFWPVAMGILCATLLNHAASAYAGVLLGGALSPALLTAITGGLFIAIGLWTLIPDKEDASLRFASHGAFLASLVTFFFAEMGDKTQLATIALGAAESSIVMVTLGTTLGMMIANVPALLLGRKILSHIPLPKVRLAAALSFIGFGVWQLV